MVHSPASGGRSALLIGLQNRPSANELIAVRDILQDHGYDCRETGDYFSAISLALNPEFDVYISDREFPITDIDNSRNRIAPRNLRDFLSRHYRAFNYAVICDRPTDTELPEGVKILWRKRLREELVEYLGKLRGP
ncbi:MAG: hypothetical protein HY368_00845 [Candidatus Aenigmarchaeota archaeon]|nr:hypothetical protein [Candidatus Aenigmarchaeota archaeon]